MLSILCLATLLGAAGCATGYEDEVYADGLGSDAYPTPQGYYYEAPREFDTTYYSTEGYYHSGPYYHSRPYYYGGYPYRYRHHDHHHHRDHDHHDHDGGRDRDRDRSYDRHDDIVRDRRYTDRNTDTRVRDRNQQENHQDAARPRATDRNTSDRGDRYRGGNAPTRSEVRPAAPRGGTRDSSPPRSSGSSGGGRSTRSPSK